MLKPRFFVLFLALPMAACGQRELPISAEPLRPRGDDVTFAPAGPVAPDPGLPHTANGVLPPGAANKVLPIGAQPAIKLLASGAEPRADLSYALVKGASHQVVMSLDLAMSVKAGGESVPQMPMPRMTIRLEITAADKNATNEFKIDSVLSRVGVEPNGGQQEQMAKAIRPQLDAMKGLGISYWINAKGHARNVRVAMPLGISPLAQQLLNGISQSFESMVTPLPAEPVGVGGKWQVTSRTTGGGVDILQASTYTLKARNGSRVTLEVSVVQLAADDLVHGPQMPAGMSAKLKGFRSNGTGTSQVDLTSIAPAGGSMKVNTGLDLTVVGGGPESGGESTVETISTVHIMRP